MIWNSGFVAVVGTIVNVLLNTMSGYVLARRDFAGKKLFFGIIVLILAVPGQVLMIPNYIILAKMGLLNSLWSLILPASINASYIFMMRQFYINFPVDVEEAASIDGLSKIGTFFKMALPLAKPALGAQAIFIFMGFWNEFMKPLLYISSASKYTLPRGLESFKSTYFTEWNKIMTASVISILPILIMYIILNKYFMSSMRMGGEK